MSVDSRRLVVVGGGNATAIFATLAKKYAGMHVSVLTRSPEKWCPRRNIGFVNEDLDYINETEIRATIDCITADPAECIPAADIIMIAGLPGHLNPVVVRNLKPFLDPQKEFFIGSISTYGGFNWIVESILGKGRYHIFGTQLIPWCCGTKKYGHTGVVFGAKRFLRIVTESGSDGLGVKDFMSKILQIPDLRDCDFLCSLFWPNNPWIHPPILYGLFKDWDGKTPYRKSQVPKFIYKEMIPASAHYLELLNTELMGLVKAVSNVYPRNPHLRLNYNLQDCVIENYTDQIVDSSTMGSTFITNKAFSGHTLPYTPAGKLGGEELVIPTLSHKFFHTDLPFGLCTFKDIANMLHYPTPVIDEIILWNQKLIGKEYLTDSGRIDGKNANECILPSRMGLSLYSLAGSREKLRSKL